MSKTREEMLESAELSAEEASKLYREFIAWKHKVIDLAKDELFYPGMKKSVREKAITPDKLVNSLNKLISRPNELKELFKVQDAQKELKEKEDQAKLEVDYRNNEEIKLTEEAAIYLQEHGRVLGKDFSLETAIFVADNVAFELEKERVLTEKNFSFFSFTGNDNCNENCAGWDGVSHRCDCGNRRVDWEFDTGHSFKNPSICAQAY